MSIYDNAGPRPLLPGIVKPEKPISRRHYETLCPHGWLVWPNYWATSDKHGHWIHGPNRCVRGV